MARFQGFLGIFLILGIAFLCSNNKKRINLRLVVNGIVLQALTAVLVLKVPHITHFFQILGLAMRKIEMFSRAGVAFIYRGIVVNTPTGMTDFQSGGFVFAFSITATIILVCVLVAILYHFGVMQLVVSAIAKAMNYVMKVSGAEALSNVASAFVGQIEAQVMIRPYLASMTNSELLASMSGSLACIAGGILIVYANMGAKAEYLLATSLMAAPGALVISKIVFPETEESPTMGKVKLEIKKPYSNIIDAIAHGAGDGMKIALNVMAMLIGFIALIAMVDWMLLKAGHLLNAQLNLSLNWIFGKLFYPIAWSMGIPNTDVANAATLLGQKLTINEFVAFNNLTSKTVPIISDKGMLIVSIAICGFANFSSVGMQIGGIGELAPTRKADLAKLGFKALLCGTLASYLSATIAGILIG